MMVSGAPGLWWSLGHLGYDGLWGTWLGSEVKPPSRHSWVGLHTWPSVSHINILSMEKNQCSTITDAGVAASHSLASTLSIHSFIHCLYWAHYSWLSYMIKCCNITETQRALNADTDRSLCSLTGVHCVNMFIIYVRVLISCFMFQCLVL